MMEDHEFCDSCPGCRPAVIDLQTGAPLPDDSPEMQAVNHVWDNDTTYAQRRAYIEFTLKNSCDVTTVRLAEEVLMLIKTALRSGTTQ